jgi:hypothetical protein
MELGGSEVEENKPDGTEPLKNARQETFCQLMSTGTLSASEAYRQAGYSHITADANSHRLQTVNESIKPRIAFLRAELAKRLDIDRERLAGMSLRVYDAAMVPDHRGKPDLSAANGAITNIGRTFGLLTDVSRDDTNKTDISEQRRKELLEASRELTGGGTVIDISKARSAG